MAAAALGISRSLQRGGANTAVTRRSALLMLAAAVPSAFSIGYAICTAYACERTFQSRERNREAWELENFPEGETLEMVDLYMLRGMSRADAIQIVDILAKNPETLVDMMMVEELGYSRIPIPSTGQTILRGSIPAALSGSLCAVVPLLPLLMVQAAALGGSDGGSQAKILRMGEVLLSAQVIGLSILQGRLLYGEYWKTDHGTTKLVTVNTLWIGVVYLLSRAMSL